MTRFQHILIIVFYIALGGLSVIISFIFFQRMLKQNSSPTSTSVGLVYSTEAPSPTSVQIKNKTVEQRTYFVSYQGNDSNDGRSRSAPLYTIQKAIDIAYPGDTIFLLPGMYFQDAVTKRSGTLNNPITIYGTKDAVVKGDKMPRIFEINHDYISLKGFTVDGLYGDPNSAKGYRDKLIYALGKSPRKGVTHLTITNMDIRNAGGECIRLRYFAQQNEIAYNTIARCGIVDFIFKKNGKNGEGIYIGTAPEQLRDGKNPTKDRDISTDNWIHHNVINTQGNECVDIKEGSYENIVEYNSCTGQKDPDSGGLDARGNNNVFRYNEIFENIGAGVRLGGDRVNDGINNAVYGNIIRNNLSGGIKVQRRPQGNICGNTMEQNTNENAVGSYRKEINPTRSCN